MTLTCRPFRVVALSALAGAWMCAQPLAQGRDLPATAPAGTLTLGGIVVLDVGPPPTPVRRARVTLAFDGAFPTRVADTDTDGLFHFDGLPAGTARLLVEKPGFVPIENGPGRSTVRPIVVTIAPGPEASLTVVMQHAAAMEGRILDEKGEPAAGMLVSAARLVYGRYGKQPSVIRQATTDDLGRFRVHTLPSGEYYLEAAPDPLRAITGPSPARSGEPGFALSYYPGTPRPDDARLVTVGPGEDVPNLDFAMTPVRMAGVQGSVTDTAGRTPASVGVRIQRVGAPPGEVRGFIPRPGTFQFPSVPPGEYWLLASALRAPGEDLEYAAMHLNISGQDLSGLILTTTKGAPVNGRVEAEGGAAVPANLRVLADETEFELPTPQPPPPAASPAPGTVAADGGFAFRSVFGSRLFRVDHLPDGWALASVALDGVDVTDTPVEFGGAKPRALRVVITNQAATVSGTLESAQGVPSAGRVVIFSGDRRQWGVRSRTTRTIDVPSDGTYSIAGLLPGRYFVAAIDYLDDGAWNDPDVLARLQAAAQPLEVAAGQAVTLPLKLR